MCSGSEAGSYLRLIDFVHHSTLGLRVIKRERERERERERGGDAHQGGGRATPHVAPLSREEGF